MAGPLDDSNIMSRMRQGPTSTSDPYDDPFLIKRAGAMAYGPVYSSAYSDAMKSAKANEMGHALGMQPDVIEANMPDMTAAARVQKRIAQTRLNSTYAQLMSNTRLAASAMDDDHLPSVAAKTDDHILHLNTGMPFGGQMQLLRYLGGKFAAGSVNLVGTLSGLAQSGAELIGDVPGSDTFKDMPGIVYGSPWKTPLSALGAAHAPTQRLEKRVTPNETDSWLVNSIGQGAYSAPGSIAALGSAALGQPEIGAAIIAGQTYSQTYDSGREAGLTPGEAARYASTDAFWELATEYGPQRIFAGMGGGDLLKKGVKFLGAEVGGEMLATATQGLDQWYWVGQKQGQTFDQFVSTLPEQEAQTVIAVLATAGMSAPLAHSMGQQIKKRYDTTTAQNVDRIMEAAASSPARTNNPTDFQQALNQVLDGSAAENLYVPADKVMEMFTPKEGETGPTPKITEDPFWGPRANEVQQAAQLGQDVVVPLSEAATHLSGSTQWESLREHVRAEPGALSIAEAKEKAKPEELDRLARQMSSLVESATPMMHRAQAMTAARQLASTLGANPDEKQALNQIVAEHLYTRFSSENTQRVSQGLKPLTMQEFAAAHLPTVQKQLQSEYERTEGTLEQPPEPDYTGAKPGTAPAQENVGEQGTAQGTGGDQAPAGGVPGRSVVRGGPELLAAATGQELGPDKPLTGSPQSLTIPGVGQVAVRPYGPARDAAIFYMRTAGLTYRPATSYAKLDEGRATRLANAFEELKHEPNDPLVKAAYQALVDETNAQFEQVLMTGLSIEFIREDQEDPYAASPRMVIEDIHDNNHMWVFPTTGGFGQGEVIDSPLLQPTKFFVDGRLLLANDVFRIVHDFFGHVKDGHGFRAEGEENAWQSHAAMYTPLARRAMTTETRGQNSWLNFGPHGETNRNAATPDTTFAPQKVGLMPEWASTEGMLAAPTSGMERTYGQENTSNRPYFSGAYDLDRYGTGEELTRPPVDEEGQVQLEHFSQEEGLTETDPSQWGRGKAFYSKEERNYLKSAPPRTYFGIATNQPGGYKLEFAGRTPYAAKLQGDKLYDAVADPDGLWQRGKPTQSEWAIKNAGYSGYWLKHNELGLVGVVFDPLPVSSIAPVTLNQSTDPSGFTRIAPYLTPDEQNKLQERSKQKIVEIMDTLPSAEEMAAVAHAGRAKKGWYQRSAQALVDVFGTEDATRFAALLAAFSPQTSVEQNFYNAVAVWTAWNNADRPTDRASILQIMGENVQGEKGLGSVLGAWKNNAFAALSDKTPGSLKLSGPKVNSFFANLIGVTDEVTNDSWMARFAGVPQERFKKTGDNKGPGYKAMNAVTRQAASILTEKTGYDWTPAEVQETVWSFAKTLYEMRNQLGESRTMQELLDAGGVTHEDVGGTPDFSVLFTHGIFRKILEAGGYGDKVADLEGAGRIVRLDEATGPVTSGEGSGFAQDDYRGFLTAAAQRLETSRDQRRANRVERVSAAQLPLTLNQSVTPQEDVFYSNAVRAVENAKMEKASPEQWAALLTPGRTPGIKAEEIEWTGILDWLKMQKGAIEKPALLQVLRDRGIEVMEVTLGENPNETPELPSGYEITQRTPTSYRLFNPNNDLIDTYPTERAAIHAAHEDADMGDHETQFENWSSDPSNPTYRELLMTLPIGYGSNPKQSPDTHWQTEAVVAHTRFMDKTDAEGKRVLFIEEVQSDWHQKGRDQGYELEGADLQQRIGEKKATLDKALDQLGRAEMGVIEKAPEVLEKWRQVAMPDGVDLNETGQQRKSVYVDLMHRIGMWREIVDRADRIKEDQDGQLSEPQELLLRETQRGLANDIEWFVRNAAFEPVMREELHNYRNADLVWREAAQAYQNSNTGIPNAPFKSSWPALVMKRVIRYAVDNGYDKVAWTTGEEQADRYNLGETVGSITSIEHEGLYHIGMQGRRAMETIADHFEIPRDEGTERLVMTEAQVREVFGKDLGGRIIEQTGNRITTFEGVDLHVGGEGMKAFYDRNLVNITNDIIKKHGAKVEQVDVTPSNPARRTALIDRMRERAGLSSYGIGSRAEAEARIEEYKQNIANGVGDTDKAGQWIAELQDVMPIIDELERNDKMGEPHPGFEITPQLAEAASGGFPLFQGKRGNITITPGDNGLMRSALIRAFEAANFSTAVHELGHFFLEDLKRQALGARATDQARRDWQAFKDWSESLGHPVDDNGPIPVDGHEFFARGFERYIYEGKAPSLSLRGVFTRMREFMLRLYRTATAFNSPITPEIRQVMDRMLVSQQEIDAQIAELNLVSKAVKELLSPSEQKAYDDLAEEGRQNARDQLYERVLSKLKAQKQAEVRTQRDGIRSEVEEQVSNQPIHKAMKILRVGIPKPDGTGVDKAKLSREWLNETYGEGIEAKLPKSVPPIVSDNDTMDADHVAKLAGFDNGDEMIQALMAHEDQRQQQRSEGDRRSVRMKQIDDMVDDRAKQEIGDPYAHLEEEARDAVANERQADLMSMEMRALARKTGQKPTPWKLAKEWAKARIEASTAREAITGTAIQKYAHAVSKAGREFEEALVKGDFDEAFRAKQRQLLNMALMSEAKKAANDVDAAVRRMRKISKRDTIPSVDQDYLDQAHALLADVDLKSNYAKADRVAAFTKWHAEQVESGVLPVVPPEYRDLLGKTHWSKLSVPELLELDKAVGQIIELGRLKRTLLDGKGRRDFEDVKQQMIHTAGQQKPRRNPKTLGERSLPERFRSILRGADAAMVKVEEMTRWLDGEDPTGPWTRFLLQPIMAAQNAENETLRNYVRQINEAIQTLPKKLVRQWSNTVNVPELMTKEFKDLYGGTEPDIFKDQIVMMAMNWGNEGNKQRLLDGYGWEEASVLRVLDRVMTKEDWDFVQRSWDIIDQLWPDVAQLEKRVNGIEPEKVEALPVLTKFGVYRGGYFPIIYDPTMSHASQITEDNKLSPHGGFMTVETRASSTKQRAERVDNRPLLLQMQVITRHVGEVIHDITHREAVQNAKKILGDSDIGDAVRTALGPEYIKAMTGWLENVAQPGAMYSKANPMMVKIGRWLNQRVTIVGLGFRVTATAAQLLGVPLAAGEVGEVNLLGAMRTVMAHPVQSWNEVQSRSSYMRSRADTLDATLEEMVHAHHAGKLQKIGPKGLSKYALRGIAYMDMVTSTTVWTAGFNKALKQGLSEDEAIAYADSTVRRTQGGGGQADRSAIMNEHPMVRALYPFFSYLNALYNMQRDVFRTAGEGRYLEASRKAWWVMVVPMLLQAALFGQGPDPGDDGEVDVMDWARYFGVQTLLGNLSSIPGIGTLASALGNNYTYRATSYNTIGEGIIKTVKNAKKIYEGDKEFDGSVVKSTLNTVGLIFAQPLGQIGSTAGGLYDYFTGEADPQNASDWYNLLSKGRIPTEKAN